MKKFHIGSRRLREAIYGCEYEMERKWRIRRRILYILLGAVALFLDIYAWRFALRSTFWIFFGIGFSIGLFWFAMNLNASSKIREILSNIAFMVAAACILLSLLGAYTLVSPSYRAKVVETQLEWQGEIAESLATEKKVAEIVALVDLPDEGCSSEYRTGKMLIVIHGSEWSMGINSLGLDSAIATKRLEDASSIVWIEEQSTIVGSYHRKILGPITAGKTGNALLLTWRVWVVDIKSGAVTAYKKFIGPDPPKTIEHSGDSGIVPEEDVAGWLENLLTGDPEPPLEE